MKQNETKSYGRSAAGFEGQEETGAGRKEAAEEPFAEETNAEKQ